MRKTLLGFLTILALFYSVPFGLAAETDGFVPIFNGKDLDGWDGNPAIWSVEDGCITGVTGTNDDNKLTYNEFLIWRQGEVDDFVLTFDFKLSNPGNSGMQVRSWEDVSDPEKPWRVYGYQPDFDGDATYTGIIYGENYRGILAQRGQETVIGDDHKPKEVKRFAEDADIKKQIKIEDWNHYEITAQGDEITAKVNGVMTSKCTDNDKEMRRRSGIVAIQVHVGPAMKVQIKNLLLKRLPLQDKKKIVLIGGPRSHGYGMHTHTASFKLVADWLNKYTNDTLCAVYTNGWPKDPTAFDNADCVVVFCDGGGGHIAIPHIDQLRKLMAKGVGVMMFHYAVEMPAGREGDFLRDATGGYFELNWSVNPFFNAEIKTLCDHPVTRGVVPFSIDDEWYYHMRFRPDMKGVTPILSCVPPDNTREQPFSAHGGNQTVRDEKGNTEHLAWCVEREDGGRGLGFTGGHIHWNWAHPQFRKFVLNAIVWTAGAEVPANGVDVPTPTWEELEANQDYEPNMSPADIQHWKDKIKKWNE